MIRLTPGNSFDGFELLGLEIKFQVEHQSEQELFNIIERKLSI